MKLIVAAPNSNQ